MNQHQSTQLRDLLADLYGRINYERRNEVKPFDFKLDGIIQLLGLLGDPQLKYPVIHVAGTKGKGSVSKMIGAILSQNGMKTGVYTSPHLESINQRIAVNDQWISDDDLADTLQEIGPAVAEVDRQSQLAGIRPLSFFEVITSAAFFHFARVNAEAVVLEVGMGGRLDSTNVCQPDLCVITNISLDHTRQLGNSLEKIAREKAGIIKQEVPLICGVTKLKPQQEIHQIAKSKQVDVWQVEKDFYGQFMTRDEGISRFDAWSQGLGTDWKFESAELSVPGEHQIKNATLAIAASQRLAQKGWAISKDKTLQALRSIQLPGRTELVQSQPPVVVDMAHNAASIEALIQTLDCDFSSWKRAKRKRLVLAISKDKDAGSMLRQLVDNFDEIVVTEFQSNPRSKPLEQLRELAEVTSDGLRKDTLIVPADNPQSAWDYIKEDLQSDDFVCITGSVFLVAEMRPILCQIEN